MIALTVNFTGIQETIAELDRRLALAKSGIEADMAWFGEGAKAEMIATHTFQNRTFRLEGSIDYDVHQFDLDGAYVTVFALTGYATQVEFGQPGRSRPYPFFWPIWYKWVPLLEEKMQEDWPQAFAG